MSNNLLRRPAAGSTAKPSVKVLSRSYRCALLGMPEEDDRLSNLPVDVLLNIIERLDIADATRTSILSRRWKQIPTMLSKILIMVGSTDNVQERTCEDVARANATMLGATRSLLESRSTSPYTIQRLCLQFFLGDGSIGISSTSAKTIATQKAGVAKFTILTEKEGKRCSSTDMVAYGTQFSSLINDCPDTFSCLTRLKLENLSLGESDFPRIFRLCKRLEFLHLDNCDMGFRSLLYVEHPRLRELDIFRSDFERVDLNWVPELTTLTFSSWISLHEPLSFGYVPLLHTVSITNMAVSWQKMFKLSEVLGKATISNLHLGFEREKVCDCLGIRDKDKRKMLEFSEERKDAGAKWEASDFKHHNLSVLRIFGFQSEDKFVGYVRAVMEAAVNLKDIYLSEKPACKVQCRYIRRQGRRYPWSRMEKTLVGSSLGMRMRPLLRLHFV